MIKPKSRLEREKEAAAAASKPGSSSELRKSTSSVRSKVAEAWQGQGLESVMHKRKSKLEQDKENAAAAAANTSPKLSSKSASGTRCVIGRHHALVSTPHDIDLHHQQRQSNCRGIVGKGSFTAGCQHVCYMLMLSSSVCQQCQKSVHVQQIQSFRLHCCPAAYSAHLSAMKVLLQAYFGMHCMLWTRTCLAQQIDHTPCVCNSTIPVFASLLQCPLALDCLMAASQAMYLPHLPSNLDETGSQWDGEGRVLVK